MKVFTPGTIARAQDVNENFQDLKSDVDALYAAAGLVADAHTPCIIGEKPPVGTILKRRSWLLQGKPTDNYGGCWLNFPETFKGITNIQYSGFFPNLIVVYSGLHLNEIHLNGFWLDGGQLANSAILKAFVTVEGW